MPIRTEWWTLLTQLTSTHFQFRKLKDKNVVFEVVEKHLLKYIWAEKGTPTLVTHSQCVHLYAIASGVALKAAILDRMFCFCLNFIFLSAWYFWIHCCLLICPLMLSEALQNSSQLITPLRHCQSPKKQMSKCYCMPGMASFSYVFGLYNKHRIT